MMIESHVANLAVRWLMCWDAHVVGRDNEPHCGVLSTDQTCLLQLHSADDNSAM